MRKITNLTSLTRAIPTAQMEHPLSMSFRGIDPFETLDEQSGSLG
jgi:hypothetical protein